MREYFDSSCGDFRICQPSHLTKLLWKNGTSRDSYVVCTTSRTILKYSVKTAQCFIYRPSCSLVTGLEGPMNDMGSCGLHVIHGAFQTGHKAAGWTINEALRGLYGIFKDSPARRADYIAVTGCSVFPKKFCQVRWLANAEVATRAVEVLPHVKKYMESVKKLPITVTCRNVAKACDDSLMTAKLSFFSSVATMFEPFLRKFQTAEPMAVFLYEEMTNLLRSVLKLA